MNATKTIGTLMAMMLLVALVLITDVVPAQNVTKNTDAESSKSEKVTIDGDHWKVTGDEKARVYTITGNVIVKYQDTTITADKGVYSKVTETVVAEGNLKIVDTDNEITGPSGTALLNERRVVIDGPVKMVARPRPKESVSPDSFEAKLREPATITCDKLEYQYRKKVAIAEGNLKVVQKGQTLVGKKAVYEVSEKLLTLSGGFTATDEKGQVFSTTGTGKASLKEGSEWIEAESGSATIEVDLEEFTEDSTNSSNTKPTQPTDNKE